jgi:hypothetical protein
MQQLRMMTRFIRVLATLFVVAQFSGVVSSPLAQARPAGTVVTSHIDHRHMHGHDHGGCAQQDRHQCGDHADYCCALHAFFAGVLPPGVVMSDANIASERLPTQIADAAAGLNPDRLDRPPRPLL